MSIPQDGGKCQSIYPTVQAHSGMDARAATVFKIPVFALFLAFFAPLYLVISLCTIYFYSDFITKTDNAGMTLMTIIGFMLFGVVTLVGLLYARSIVGRNSAHPLIIFLLYLFIIVPVIFLFMSQAHRLFSGITVMQLLGYEAIVVAVPVLALVLLARRMSR